MQSPLFIVANRLTHVKKTDLLLKQTHWWENILYKTSLGEKVEMTEKNQSDSGLVMSMVANESQSMNMSVADRCASMKGHIFSMCLYS